MLQRHTRALAKSDIKEEFLSGAGCASLLLLEDDDIEQLLATAEEPAAATSAAASSRSYIATSSSNGNEKCSEYLHGKRRRISHFDDIQLDRRRIGKRKPPYGLHDDICTDRARLAKRMGGTSSKARRSIPSDAVQVSLTGHEPAALSAQDAPT
jgi:hypothetical protein